MPFSCTICNKDYKSYQSLYNHNHRYHSDNNAQYKCMYCKKKYSRNDTLVSHQKNCKLKDKPNPTTDDIFEGILTGKYNRKEAANLIQNCNNKQLNTGFMNNGEINDSFNTNNTNNTNNTSNINVNISMLGEENFLENLSESEQKNILNQKGNSLKYMIEKAHFNKKYPQFHNFGIIDLKNPYALIYDDDKKDYKMIRTDELLDSLIEHRINDIAEMMERHKTEVSETTSDRIPKFINKMVSEYEKPNSKYIKEQKRDIVLIGYNNKTFVKERQNEIKKRKLRRKELKELCQ